MKKCNLQRAEIERIYGKISPFELKDRLIGLANESGAQSLLDAGRGNPNWTAATPREAFFLFGLFAVEETRRNWSVGDDLAGMPQKNGIAKRLTDYLTAHATMPGAELLRKIIEHGIAVNGFVADDWVFELADGIIGDNYPLPSRMLRHVETVVRDYLERELRLKEQSAQQLSVFGVEGATAGMCYIFDSLIANNIISKGDKIALMAPIFTPYLEIPHLPRYNLEVVEVVADELTVDGIHTWQYSPDELQKLCDPTIKALFIVNPSNPASVALRPQTIKRLREIVERHNRDLMIISDDVYGTFVDEFQSLLAELPYNSIGVYSFSKYFGVTGWRLGTIALYKDNVFDKLLREQDEDKKSRARRRYAGISIEPDKIPFIERIVADSRQVALNHTAGLSTPQQVQMAFFSLFALIDEQDRYKKLTMEICRRRKRLLFEGLGLKMRQDANDASYYTQFDLLEWAAHYYNEAFARHLQERYKPVDILLRLAEEFSIVLLGGNGFHASEWSIRISLANLGDEAYSRIGEAIGKILQEFVTDWQSNKNN